MYVPCLPYTGGQVNKGGVFPVIPSSFIAIVLISALIMCPDFFQPVQAPKPGCGLGTAKQQPPIAHVSAEGCLKPLYVYTDVCAFGFQDFRMAVTLFVENRLLAHSTSIITN